MGDHTRKKFYISLSQENKFSFEGEWGHFRLHLVPKNAEFLDRAVFGLVGYQISANCKNS